MGGEDGAGAANSSGGGTGMKIEHLGPNEWCYTLNSPAPIEACMIENGEFYVLTADAVVKIMLPPEEDTCGA